MEFEIQELIPAVPGDVYHAWLDSELHSKMTGGKAEISPTPGETFTAWNGYISGKNIALEAGSKIIQAWRTADFTEDEKDSHLEINFMLEEGITRVIIHHTDLPPHGKQYEQGWFDSYLEPMKRFFSSLDSS
jgi:activator of HSP90 ATPase